MKIEIAESLMMSYFKHVKKCCFYQLNWKVSSNWEILPEAYDKAHYVYNKICNDQEFSDIFKSEYSQLIKQSEIDIIGMDSHNKVYVADVAFHEAGLNYGSKIETKNRVFKKLLRSYLTLLTYFPNYSYELIFASPKVNPATENIIKNYFSALDRNYSSDNVNYYYYSNEIFLEKILLPTISLIRNDSDTNELCGRAFKLLDIFSLIKEQQLDLKQTVQPPKTMINSDSLILEFNPTDEKIFKQKLLIKKAAKRTIIYNNGRETIEHWDASKFTETSNLRGNIMSNHLIRRWRELGITRIKFEIEE